MAERRITPSANPPYELHDRVRDKTAAAAWRGRRRRARFVGMKKQTSRSKTDRREIIGRERFERISAVEGIRLSGEMKRAFAEFERRGLSAEERRRVIVGRFKGHIG
jgi:hypothetical protein